MKKRVLVFWCAILLISTLSACGEKETSGPSCLDIVKACSALTDDGFDTWTSYGEDLYQDSFDNMYGIPLDTLIDGAILYTEQGGKADEITVMHLEKSADISIAKEKLEQRIQERKNVFANYKPEEVSKLEKAYVMVQGNYVVLIIAEDGQQFETEIRRVISEGGN